MLWTEKLHAILVSMNFTRCPTCPCLYYWEDDDGDFIIVFTHVDDGIFATTNPAYFQQFVDLVQREITKITITQSVRKYVGLELDYNQLQGQFIISINLIVLVKKN